MATNLYAAHNQWRDRPADERFWGLDDMGAVLMGGRRRSSEVSRPVTKVQAIVGSDGASLCLDDGRDPMELTHWSMGQLSTYADAPASYLRGLPAELAAANINHGLARYHGEDVQFLIERDADRTTMRAMTTAYSRLWNADIVRALKPATEAGWMVPPARPAVDDPRARPATLADIVPGQDNFGLSVKVGQMIAPAGVYASDRDMFVFLVHPQRIIDIDGDSMMRGFFLWNSEVGAGAFKVQCFYLESVCGNHISWGAKGVQTLRVVHKGNNFANIGHRLSRELRQLTDADTTAERAMVQRARAYVIGKDRQETVDTLFANRQLGLSRNIIEATYTVAEEWEHTAKAPPVTAWGFCHGLTRFSQATPHADERAKLDAAAGKILQLAYTAKG